VFSVSALASPSKLDEVALARFGVLQGTEAILPARSVLGLSSWPELETALPDRGFPRGVIEIAALPQLGSRASHKYPGSMRGGGTSIAIAAMSAVHAADEHAWCAWITPSSASELDMPSLYAPALVRADVDLDRLLVVRPPPSALARTVVKMAASGAFDLVIVDVPQSQLSGRMSSKGLPSSTDATIVRKLALAAEECGTTSLLLTSALAPRTAPWPVALRLEVERRPDALALRVTKDRRGCGSSQHVIRLAS
jgi:recombination protein RecA